MRRVRSDAPIAAQISARYTGSSGLASRNSWKRLTILACCPGSHRRSAASKARKSSRALAPVPAPSRRPAPPISRAPSGRAPPSVREAFEDAPAGPLDAAQGALQWPGDFAAGDCLAGHCEISMRKRHRRPSVGGLGARYVARTPAIGDNVLARHLTAPKLRRPLLYIGKERNDSSLRVEHCAGDAWQALKTPAITADQRRPAQGLPGIGLGLR